MPVPACDAADGKWAGSFGACNSQNNAMPPTSLYRSLDLKGRRVLVTGATAGIGERIAWRFAELGASPLWLVGRRKDRLDALAKELAAAYGGTNGCDPRPLVLDVTDEQALVGSSDKPGIFQTTGPIDILVNNAGLALGVAKADEAEVDDVRKMFECNVLGSMTLSKIYGSDMRRRATGADPTTREAYDPSKPPHVIFISSVAGKDYYEGGSAYCATKAAIDAFTYSYRMDVADTPVRVSVISPGLCQTEFSAVRFKLGESESQGQAEDGRQVAAEDTQKKVDAVYADIVPLHPDDIADNVIYTCTRPPHVQIADLIVYATNQGHAKYCVKRVAAGAEGAGAASKNLGLGGA